LSTRDSFYFGIFPTQVEQDQGWRSTDASITRELGPTSIDGKFMRYVISILSLVAVLATLAGVKASQISMLMGAGKAMQKAGPPPEVVSTAAVEKQTWEGTLTAVGTVVAAKGVALSNDAAGVVTRLYFESGAAVKQGQILVELDANVERAQLASIRARKDLADTSLQRTRALVNSGSIAPAQLDTDESSLKSLSADESAIGAQIGRKVIRAPFGGRLGIRAVNLGQYLAPGTTITVLEAIQTVFVDFTLPQQQIVNLKVGMQVRASEPGHDAALAEGTISAIEPAVDTVTRTVKVRASLSNRDERLRSGMFVKVKVVLPEQQTLVVIPATAVVHATFGDSVFCVDTKSTTNQVDKKARVARQQFVKLGNSRGDFVSVLAGLTPGEEVVSEGAFKLRNGSSLVINNEVKLDPKLAPHPDNR
jgi:membrane fusion protein (multidrug efflux system)